MHQRLKKCSCAILVDECYFEFMDPSTSVAKLGCAQLVPMQLGIVGVKTELGAKEI